MNFARSKSLLRILSKYPKTRYFSNKCDHAKGAGGAGGEKKGDKKGGDPKELAPRLKTYKIYRYSPKSNKKPYMQTYTVDLNKCNITVLDALLLIKKDHDSSLAFRKSCREGICGSCAMNIDGVNHLACLLKINPRGKSVIYPLPHMYVIKDLIVDMTHFLDQHRRIHPYLMSNYDSVPGFNQFAQSITDRDKLDGLVECILCACCSTSCPEYWWHGHSKSGKDFLGPAALLNAYRWLADTRDQGTDKRLDEMRNYFNVYRCHQINNCSSCCPKKLNPSKAISQIRLMLGDIKHKKPGEMSGGIAIEPNKMCNGPPPAAPPPPKKSK